MDAVNVKIREVVATAAKLSVPTSGIGETDSLHALGLGHELHGEHLLPALPALRLRCGQSGAAPRHERRGSDPEPGS